MSDYYPQDEIDADYERVVGKLRGKSFYGVPIDIADMKQMVIAAYLLGKYELRIEHGLRGHQHIGYVD